ncbi:MAG: hypothetical protein M3O89_10870 [Actinomycetota bacterium]|nr:hypothetical protein [Actinomycetota bacterium]
MTTVLAERFRAPVDGLTGPRIEDMLDVCVSATIDAPDPMKHPPGASFHRLTQADLECRRLAFMSSSNSELRHRKKNSMTTTIAASAAKVALQAARLCARFSADALRAPARDDTQSSGSAPTSRLRSAGSERARPSNVRGAPERHSFL